MENVLLIVELILALFLIIVVLLQRSEGGGLGMGGGGGGGVVSGRGAATALTKMTWVLAAGFFAVALSLTVMAANRASERSVIDGSAFEIDTLLPSDPTLDDDLRGLIAPPPGANPLIPPAAE
jgi:preprotein translocase subunit SecG